MGNQRFFEDFALVISMKKALEPLGIIGLKNVNRSEFNIVRFNSLIFQELRVRRRHLSSYSNCILHEFGPLAECLDCLPKGSTRLEEKLALSPGHPICTCTEPKEP